MSKSPAKSPVREPPTMFLQLGPYGERCSVSRANSLFIRLYLSESPKGGKHTVTVHGAPRGRNVYIHMRAGSGILIPLESCLQTCITIPLLCGQWKTPDDGQRNCPKHVVFYSKNKFEKLVHLVDFVMRIYHDARSSKRHIWWICNRNNLWA